MLFMFQALKRTNQGMKRINQTVSCINQTMKRKKNAIFHPYY